MRLLIILSLLMMVGCNRSESSKKEQLQQSKFNMSCDNIHGAMRRCENKEAICYTDSHFESMSCKFKEGV